MLTVFAGPMFSGKTTSLIEQSRKLGVNCIFKPRKDSRNDSSVTKSHDGDWVPSVYLDSLNQVKNLNSILVDEAQFLDKELVLGLIKLSENADIYFSMLDRDFRGKIFENFGLVQESSNSRIKHRFAKCSVCGKEAALSFRKVKSDDLVLCGAGESYEPRCYDHFTII